MFQIFVNCFEGKIFRLKNGKWIECATPRKDGYRHFYFNGKKVLCHRFIYEYFYGKIPKHLEINHKNHKKHDNRIDNLELVTKSQNNQYKLKTKRNSSGIPNISFCKSKKNYILQFCVRGHNKHFGSFTEINKNAILQRNAIAKMLNETQNCKFQIYY